MNNHVIKLPKLSLKNLIIGLIGIMFLFLIGKGFYKDTKTIKELRTEVKQMKNKLEEYQGKKDSVFFVTDTIKIVQPDKYKVTRKERDTVRIWQQKQDTLYIAKDVVLDKIQKKFEKEENYQVWISGYHDVWLDSMKFYPKTIYQKSTVIQKKRYNFGFGPQIGFGYEQNNKKFSPYIGIGLQWNLIQF